MAFRPQHVVVDIHLHRPLRIQKWNHELERMRLRIVRTDLVPLLLLCFPFLDEKVVELHGGRGRSIGLEGREVQDEI